VYVKHAAGAFNQLGVNLEGFLDRSRQTGGFGVVVSLRAILDRDVHKALQIVYAILSGRAERRQPHRFHRSFYVNAFNPIIPVKIKAMHANRAAPAGSCMTVIPHAVVPSTPIPVQTA
jgi:hypothetical protein